MLFYQGVPVHVCNQLKNHPINVSYLILSYYLFLFKTFKFFDYSTSLTLLYAHKKIIKF